MLSKLKKVFSLPRKHIFERFPYNNAKKGRNHGLSACLEIPILTITVKTHILIDEERMNATADTSTWLKTELTSALGFAEVDDIVTYVLSSFQSKQEVVPYLTELLGITPARAETICAKLFAPPPQSNTTKSKANAKAKTAGIAAANSAAGLVPPAAVPNSRLKQAKVKKTGAPKLMHAQVINCLQCGKIEHNGGRKCLFCDTELRYEELDEHEIDRAAQRHMETLVLYDETSAERTTVINTEEQFYEEVELRGDGTDSHRRPITLDLDLESRQFVVTGRDGAGRISRNQELSKDARDLCEGIQRRMEKESGRQQRKNSGSERTPADPSLSLVEEGGAAAVVVEEEYALVFV